MKKILIFQTLTSLLSALFVLGIGASKASAILLIGNTEGDNVVSFDEKTGSYLGNFIASGTGGLDNPDDLTFGPDGNLYISSGTNTSGEILRFNGKTGEFIDVFTKGGTLFRPYGTAFGPDGNLYVSSFRTDEILRFNGTTGEFIDVFAAGTGTANGLNGPNDLLFDTEGNLYVTTQGSVADGQGGINFLFDSQVLRYDLATGTSSVFVEQPQPLPFSYNFVSFLGLALGPDGNLYTSDFANGIRSYDLNTGDLQAIIPTSYVFFDDNGTTTSSNFVGNLAFAPDNTLYTVGFDFNNGNLGSILRYDGLTGQPLPFPGNPAAVFVPANENLIRPIGIAIFAQAVPESSTAIGLLSLTVLGVMSLYHQSRKTRSPK